MDYFYSASTNGFYVSGVHKTMPDDVIAITEEEHQALQGQQVYPDANGRPIAGDNPPPYAPYSRSEIPPDVVRKIRKNRDK